MKTKLLICLLIAFAFIGNANAQAVSPPAVTKTYVDSKIAGLTLTSVAWTDQTTSASTFYPSLFAAASGTGNPVVSSTKLSFVPSTGTLLSTNVAVPSLGNGKFCLDGDTCAFYIQQRAPGYLWIESGGATKNVYVNAVKLTEPSGNWELQNATGIIFQKKLDSTATPGNVTANLTASGQVAIAAGAGAVTITSDMVDTASRVFAVLQFADATCTYIKNVIPAAGSFTINMNANCTSNTKVAWNIFK